MNTIRRAIEVVFVLTLAALLGGGILFVLPFLIFIALLIKIDSKGGVFYTQKRLGKDGEMRGKGALR